MPSQILRSPRFRPGIVGQGNTAFDGTNEHYPGLKCESPKSVAASGEGIQFLAIQKSVLWEEAFRAWSLSGQTLDASSAALPGCVVDLFVTQSDTRVGTTISDGSANFTIPVGFNSANFYMVAYKPGSPDVAGTTVNTLTAT